jgi:hypothetical protein
VEDFEFKQNLELPLEMWKVMFNQMPHLSINVPLKMFLKKSCMVEYLQMVLNN